MKQLLCITMLLFTYNAFSQSLEYKINQINNLKHSVTSNDNELFIQSLFLSTYGEELSYLKEGVDTRGDYHDLEQLLFHDIDNKEITQSILTHLNREGEKLNTRKGLKFFSDIDDTIYSNIHDERIPKKSIYPGIITFYHELNRSWLNQNGAHLSQLVFLTARPFDRSGIFENKTHAMLSEMGFPSSVILMGSYKNIFSSESMAQKKIENYKKYQALYPEFYTLFIGDNGQGDIQAAMQMNKISPNNFSVALIHNVIQNNQYTKDELIANKVYLFDTYIGAAYIAWRANILSEEQVHNIINAAYRDVEQISFKTEVQKKNYLKLLDQDRQQISR